MVDVLNVQPNRRWVRRQVVEHIHQDPLRQVQRPFETGFGGACFALQKEPIEILRNVRAQPTEELQIARVADRRKAQKDSCLDSIQALDQPHDVIRVEQDLRGEEAYPGGILAADSA